MACRSGCKTKDHASYAACCRAASPVVNLRTSSAKAWDAELYAFSDARKQGIMPSGTTMDKIEQAHRISDRTGVAFDASDPTKGLL